MLFGSLLSGSVFAAAQEPPDETVVKLALVYKIARFVTWPDLQPNSDFRFCVASADLYGTATERLAGRKVRERSIRVVKIQPETAANTRCDTLYIDQDSARVADRLVNAFTGKPVLTLSDIPDFAAGNGMIALVSRNKRVGMMINVANYESVGLAINSQLLQLAELVTYEKRVAR